MKKTLAVVIVALVFSLPLSSIAGHVYFTGDTWVGVYKFDVPTGERDRWDSARQDTPPLPPGKALRVAKEFARDVPLPKGWLRWVPEPGGVVMYCVSTSGAPEEWIYVIRFYAIPEGQPRNPPYPEINIPVRMDGSIPEPVVTKKAS